MTSVTLSKRRVKDTSKVVVEELMVRGRHGLQEVLPVGLKPGGGGCRHTRGQNPYYCVVTQAPLPETVPLVGPELFSGPAPAASVRVLTGDAEAVVSSCDHAGQGSFVRLTG